MVEQSVTQQTDITNSSSKSKNKLIIIILLVLALIIALGLVFLRNSNETLNNVRNYSFTIERNMTTFHYDDEIEGTTISNGIVDLVNQTQKIYLDNDDELYADLADNITFINIMGTWYRTDGASEVTSMMELVNSINNMNESVTRISDGEYRVRMSEEHIMLQLSDFADLLDIDMDAIIVRGLYAVVHVREGFIHRVEYNFSNLIPIIPTFTIIINITNHNNSGTIIIPQNIIDTAEQFEFDF